MDVQTAKEFLERRSVDDLQSIIVLAQQQIQQIRENQKAKYMGAIRKAFEDYFENVGPIEVTYCYENRTFEVEVYNECCGCLLTIYVNEVIRPNRKFFGRTKQFYTDYVILGQYSSIDEAVKSVIAEGLKVEEQTKQVNKKWEEWSKETN